MGNRRVRSLRTVDSRTAGNRRAGNFRTVANRRPVSSHTAANRKAASSRVDSGTAAKHRVDSRRVGNRFTVANGHREDKRR